MQSKIDIKDDEESDFFFGLKNELISQKRLRSNSKANFPKRSKKRELSKLIHQQSSIQEIQIDLEKKNKEESEDSYQQGIDEQVIINRSIGKIDLLCDYQCKKRHRNSGEKNLIHKSFEDILDIDSKNSIIETIVVKEEQQQEEYKDKDTIYKNKQGFTEIQEEYNQLYIQNYKEDNYNLKLVYSNGFETILKNYIHYFDNNSCLQLRKSIVLFFELVSLICERIINSTIYKLIMLILISTNIVLVVAKYYGNFYQQNPYFFDKQSEVFFQIYVIEIIIRILGQNIIQFFKRFWNIFDLINVLILGLVIFKIISFDFSPLRAIRVLIFLSQLSQQLQITFMALIQSFQYMVESLLIVFIFCIFFANLGRQQFHKIFQNRCVNLDTGIVDIDQLCGWINCPENNICLNIPFYLSTDSITNFNNFTNSFISIIRIITMDDWTNLMYPTLYTLSPFTWIYFVFVIFIVGFFAFNLIIAILKTQYSNIVNNYQIEDIDNNNIQQDQQLSVNMRLLKNLGIYAKIKSVQKKQLQQQDEKSLLQSCQNSQQSLLQQNKSTLFLTPQITAKIVAENTIKKFEMFFKHSEQQKKTPKIAQMLSARQRKEMEESKEQESHKIVQQNWQIRSFLLPKRILFLEIFKDQIIEDNELQEIKILQSSDVLNWKIQVMYINYQSESKLDVLGQNQERLERGLKLQAELKKIQNKRAIQQYYYFKKDEINKVSKNQNIKIKQCFPIKKSTRKIQYESLTFEDLKQDQILFKSPKHSFISEKKHKFTHKRSTSTIQKEQYDQFFQFPEYEEGENYIILNGIKWNYESMQILINRNCEQMIDNNNTDYLNDQFFAYLKFRRKEIKRGYIYDSNQSIIDIELKNKINIISILRGLNLRNQEIWVKKFNIGLKNLFKKLLNSILINCFLDVIALLNFMTLSSIGYLDDDIIDCINLYVTIILGFELLLKIFCNGLIDFARIPSNIIDTIVLLISISYYFLIQSNNDYKQFSEIKVFRATNSILLYRFIKYNNFITRIMKIAKITFKKYLSLTFLMFSIMLIFSILGMQFFIENFEEDDKLSQLHSFKSFAKSQMTIFNIVTNDDAIGMLKVVLKVQQPWIGIIFYITTVFSINYLTNGLVMAVLLDAFSSELEKVQNEQIDIQQEELKKQGIIKNISIDQDEYQDQEDQQYIDQIQINQGLSDQNLQKQNQITQQTKINIHNLPETSKKLFLSPNQQNKFVFYQETKCACSCYLFSYNNQFRKYCYRISKHLLFKLIQNGLVFISIVYLVITLQQDDNYRMFSNNNQLDNYYEINYFIINTILLLTYIIQIIAVGCIMDQGALLKDFWKLVDLIYLVFFYISFVSKAKFVQIFKFLIFCRPLLFINMFQSVQGVKQAMVKSLYKIINIFAVIILVFMVFNVFGLHLYYNKMGYCDNLMNFHVNIIECKERNLRWINHPFNFDNFFNGLFTLTMISSQDAWGDIMQVCYNANTPDQGPEPFKIQWATYIFFVIFVFIGGMFFMGFLTGVLFIEFQKFTKKIENKNLTQEQSSFIQICSIILKQKPNYSHAPKSFIRKIVYKLIFSKIYKSLYNYVLVSNGILLCFLFEIKTQETKIMANWSYQLFTIVLVLDCILKVLAYGIIRYLATSWRIFELFLTLFSILDLSYDLKYRWFLQYTNSVGDFQLNIFSRFFLIMRNVKILLIFQEFIGLQRLLRVLLFSSPLLLKLLYIQISIQATYALIGTNLFGHLKQGNAIDENYSNFSSFFNSLLILFKCTTGDDWRALIIDCSRQNIYCQDDEQYCGSNWSYVYFLSYYLLSNIIVMNLFVLALVDQFENFFNKKINVIQTYVENIDHFCTCWCRYSYETKGKKMHTRYIGRFLLDLNQPLGAQKGDNIWDVAKDAFNFRIRADKRGLVNFNDLLYEIMRFAFYEKIFKEGTSQGRAEMKLFDQVIKKRLSGDLIKIQINPESNEIKAQESVDGSYDLKYGYQNFNILQEYLHLLIVLKTWKAYTLKLFEISRRGEYTEESCDIMSCQAENKIQDNIINQQLDEKHYISQAIDDQNKLEIIKTFKESNKYFQTNNFSQNSSTFLGIVYEPSYGNQPTLNRMYTISSDQNNKRSILKKKGQTYTINELLSQNNQFSK